MEAILQSGPHIHSGDATRLRMTDGAIALLPLTAGALWFFGWSAVWRLAVSLASCLGTEILWERLGKRGHPADGSALVTALLFFLTLSGRSPWWAVLLGGAAAISSKAVFGGLGKNFFNPAALGRVLLLPLLSSSPLRTAKGTFLMAYTGGAFGEVSTLLLLCGAIYLALRRLLPWAITLPYLAATFCTALWIPRCDPLAVLCWGGTTLGACFLSADPVTTPLDLRLRLLFGVFTGAAATLLAFYGHGLGGVCCAVVIANGLFRAAEHLCIRPCP